MRWIKTMAAALAVCILAGCAPAASGTQNSSSAPGQTAGRYVETDITPPGAENMTMLLLQADGNVLDFVSTEQSAPYKAHHWRSTDGGSSWAEQPVAWAGQLYPAKCAAASDGTLYFFGMAINGGEPDWQGEKGLYRAAPGGEAERLQGADWPDLSSASVWQMQMLPADRLLLCWMEEGGDGSVTVEGGQIGSSAPRVLVLESSGSQAAHTEALQADVFGGQFAGTNSQIFAVNAAGGITAVPLEGETSSLNGQTLDGYKTGALAADAEGNLYYVTDDGILRASAGGNLREVVLESGRYSFGDPMNGLEKLAVGADGDLYTALTGPDASVSLFRLRFDPTLPAQPSQRLEIYSLFDSYTVRAAVSAFRASNPDTLVEWQPALDSTADASRKEDALRSLNARLASGDGPDLLILDGIDLQQLAEKGALADLSGLVDTGGLLPAVTKGMQTETGLFAIPARFSMPVLLVEQSEKEQFSNWNNLLALAQQQPETVVIDPAQPFGPLPKEKQPALMLNGTDDLVGLLCGVYGPALLSGDGISKESALRLFEDGTKLPCMNNGTGAIISAGGTGSQAGMGVDGGASFAFSNGQARVGYTDLTEFTPLGNTAMRGVPVETVLLPGTQSGVWTPRVLAGISAVSDKKELAAQFIQTLLSEQVQNYTLGDGLPVLESGFETAWQREMERGNTSGSENILTNPLDLANALGKPMLLPDLLTDAVTDGLESCRSGGMTPAQAADELEKQMQLYFAER